MPIRFIFLAILALSSFQLHAAETVGWVEKAWVGADNIEIRAKIDSGARNSSLHCDCVKFKKQGAEWVKFTLRNSQGKVTEITKPIVRRATIKRHDGKKQVRDVIMLSVCLGSVRKRVEVNLVNREGLNYQMLIGRSFLADQFLIDTGNKYLNSPHCQP